MLYRVRVRARDYWDDELKARFGENGSLHILTDTEIVNAIMQHGRAEIQEETNGHRVITFQNDYD